MPRTFVPHASASHRVACISLYRALLKQTSLLQHRAPIDGNNPLSQIVRYRFQRDRKLISPTQVANGLNAGYAVLDLIHACNNRDKDAWKKLAEIIEATTAEAVSTSAWRTTLASARRSTSPAKAAKLEHIKAVASKEKQERYHGSKPILERPLPLSEIRGGKRRVPNLVITQGIPFLRYSKPQPVSLSRVIQQRISWNDKSWSRRRSLETAIAMAELEDKWDRILYREHGITDRDVSSDSDCVDVADPSWAEEFRIVRGELIQAIQARSRKNAEMGTVMWEVVQKERAMKEQEKAEKKAMRRAAWEARQAAEDSGKGLSLTEEISTSK